ncbi:LacI family DNA-binding transcriptional regulator [Shinella sp. 838]|uniref:LacI family DNA-binding transcriptional regulator n=1 Tax=unclassified Shinella TaxID=2643062 RepID=UPI0003C563DB|nr:MULTISPECIES: LacI family DNA-binding transcriptional regulator [unclassified Shinella]EYR78687.1 ribitol operon repressor [Shinella sp. DD12]MCA0343134.1 LacI family DNA-binding transcriptional regulator [Pseudomonadota bacterium]MDG4669577.1 LacI family DNA-binding transcriptional regulator [Shinella sp. 838]
MNRATQTKRTTIYDLAELAGTSASAVSAVLNGNWKKRRISAKLAEKITKLAEEQGYALNMQASVLRRERSKIIGMIVPKYDNRYFASIVEQFEMLARARGLFPIITCTQRDPALEVEAARAMLSYQVDCLIATGATDPDHIVDLCAAAGVRTINLDLPGTRAPSVISDNYGGALELTRRVLANCEREFGEKSPLLFVGGRGSDHNTMERVRGFRDAHAEAGVTVDETLVMTCGYAPEKAENAMKQLAERKEPLPRGMFVNSTISLEGVMRWIRRSGRYADRVPQLGCFDWDPFVAMLGDHIEMVRQDVPKMLEAVFGIIDSGATDRTVVQIPPIVEKIG